MRTAREVIGDENVAALRAEGLVIVAEADVEFARDSVLVVAAGLERRGKDMSEFRALIARIDAALAAGGE